MNPLPLAAIACSLSLSLAAPAAPAPPNAVDHAGILQSLDGASLERGATIYRSLCTNCHGADGAVAPIAGAPAFTESPLKFGADPHAMFRTLTHGNGLMAPQTWMTPEERYEVIHYIREQFMRDKREDFFEVNDGYLEELPTVNVAVSEADKVARNFGPALASQLGREVSSVLSIKLGDDTTISYDLHTMDQAGLWDGGFLNLLATQHHRERGGGVAEPQGEMIKGLQSWRWAHGGTFDYPTEKHQPRGPMPTEWLDYNGHYLHGDRVVLSYAIDGRPVLESPGKPPGYAAIEHDFTFEAGPELKLCVARLPAASASGFLPEGATSIQLDDQGTIAVLGAGAGGDIGTFVAATLRSNTGGAKLSIDDELRLVLTVPASESATTLKLVRHAGSSSAELLAFATYSSSIRTETAAPTAMVHGGELRWPEELATGVTPGEGGGAYALDTIGLPPVENPWNVWFRTSALAFFPDGRMAVSTHGGDVWIVSGLGEGTETGLRWKRFAAGMYEPFGMQVVDGLIYVTCKDRITRLHDLNADGEADFYESFYADDDVSTFFHAFNFDLQRDAEGNFYYAKSGQYTSYRLPGSVIKVSPEGKGEVYCTGFRTPNGMGMMPDGRPTVSDNQGNWMPASKISVCDPGGFYGYVQTHAKKPNWAPDGGALDHTKVVPPATFDQPLIWMPQDYDNSSGGQVWIDDERWGPLSNKLLHTSFGKGWLYYMMVQDVDGVSQAAMVKLKLDGVTGIQRARVNPKDGQVYAVGLNGWNGNGRKGLAQGGIHRFRYTADPSAKLLTGAEVVRDGIRLDFDFPLAADGHHFEIEQWDYRWRSNYGSKFYSVKNPGEMGKDRLEVAATRLGEDGRSLSLDLPDIHPCHQLKLKLTVKAKDGSAFEEEVYFTINRVPDRPELSNMKAITASRSKELPPPKKKNKKNKK